MREWSHMRDILISWNKSNNERIKLQYAYATLAIVLLFVSGIIGLLNYSLGRTLLGYVVGLVVLFFCNAISWVLLDAFILRRLSRRPNAKK